MNSFTNRLAPIVLLLAALPSSSYSKHREAPTDPAFLAIQEIVILPVVDARAGKKDKVNLDTSLRKTAQHRLKKKNYAVKLSDTTGPVGQVEAEDLSEAKPEWIKKLGPADARWVMVVGISDVHSKITFGSTGNAEVFGFLYDKDAGRLIWRQTSTGRVGQGGLMGMALKGAMSSSAIQTATFNLISGFPRAPKRRG